MVHRTGQHGWRSARSLTTSMLWSLGLKQWGRHAPLYQLPQQLMAWNAQRRKHGDMALSVQDLEAIRQMIRHAGAQSSAALQATLLDQWFFLAVGAIRVQSQTGSRTAWTLLEQSVHTQLASPAPQRLLSLGMLVTACICWMSSVQPYHAPAYSSTSPLEEVTATADPVTLSLLQLAYSKMKSGTCQLPQAAMLPEPQREAFMLFVTQGTVDVEHVERLREALGYVNCLYPQELMRPQGRDRLTRL